MVKWKQLGVLQSYYKSEFYNTSSSFKAFVNLSSSMALSVDAACFSHEMISIDL